MEQNRKPMEQARELLAQAVIKNLKMRGMDAEYHATAEEARKAVLSQIPEGSSVTWGGSMTLEEMGVLDAVKQCLCMIKKQSTKQ